MMTDEVMGEKKNKKLTYQVMQCDCKMLQGIVTGAGEICVIQSGQTKVWKSLRLSRRMVGIK